MSTNKNYPIYKFASLRSPQELDISPEIVQINPTTALVDSLISINESEGDNAEKLIMFNGELQAFIDEGSFIKTKVQFDAMKTLQDEAPSPDMIDDLYNNVLVRTLTKSTTNRIYKLMVDQLKSIYSMVYGAEVSSLRIVIPDRLNFTFTGFVGPDAAPHVSDAASKTAIINRLEELTVMQNLVEQAKAENVLSFQSPSEVLVRNVEHEPIISALGKSSVAVDSALLTINNTIVDLDDQKNALKVFNQNPDDLVSLESSINAVASTSPEGIQEAHSRFTQLRDVVMQAQEDGVENFVDSKTVFTEKYAVLSEMGDAISIEEAENYIKDEMKTLSVDLHKVAPNRQYSLVGDNWVETSEYAAYAAAYEPLEAQLVTEHHADCNLKFPFQVADLRVVEQQPVGYLPGEIAHINNTQAGERNTKVTRRLKKVESNESLITDDEVFRETDTQSTEKFGLEREASNVQTAAQSFNVNASAAAKFGAYSLSVDAGYSSSSSSTISNSTSQSHAKEVVEAIVDRVSNRVRSERSVKTIEEFEETVTHEIDNIGQGPKSYVYRWLNKLVRATLKNYGKRLIFQFDVAHPAHYYLSRAIQDLPSISLPPDPRELSVDGKRVLAIENLSRDNYLAWGAVYKTELEQPPVSKMLVSEVLVGDTKASTGKLIPIAKGYKAVTAKLTNYVHNIHPGPHTILTIGNAFYAQWDGGGTMWAPITFWLNNETDQLPVAILAGNNGFSANIEITCDLTEDAYMAWKIKTYNALVAAYEGLKTQAEDQLSGFNPNLPGLHPAKKQQLIMEEIKRETLRKMFRCNPFWVNDNYVVGNEYVANCCQDSFNAEKVRFLERVFDWDNMTYELHPYFYASKANWSQLLDLSDDDPHFEAFLRSSFATIQVPVHRDSLKETAAVNFIRNNSIANYEVVPEDMQAVLAELDNIQPTLFTYDLDGNELPEPKEEVDLGIFNLPTSLVILECGTSEGVKPIGFPQSEDEPTSDVILPKQYSPAIIADSCTP